MSGGVRILFVESYPLSMFGQQYTMLSLIDRCAHHGIAPVVVCPSEEGSFVDAVRQRGLVPRVFEYPESMRPYGGAVYSYGPLQKLRLAGDGVSYAMRIRKALKSEPPDAVFCNDMRGLLTVGIAARLLGIPVMIWDKLDRPHGALDWVQVPIASQNLIISNPVAEKYPRWQRRVYARRILRVNNGIDTARMATGRSVRHALGLSDEHVVLGMVGSISARKGHDRLLAVFGDLAWRWPKLRLLIAGAVPEGGAEKSFFENLANRDNAQVMWLGYRDDIADILASLDVFVMLSRHEGMGRAAVEAMAAGLPVVAARTGGLVEVVADGETGLLVDGGDEGALSAALSRVIGDRDLRQRFGQAGRVRARSHFEESRQIGRVLEHLAALARGSRASGEPSKADAANGVLGERG